MKKILGILLTSLFIWTACGKSDEIRIGVSLPLTGALSPYGVESQNGMLLAADTINKKGGVKGYYLKLVINDNQGNMKETQAIYEKLAKKNNIVAMVGPLTGSNALSLKPLVEQYKIPTLLPAATDSILTEGNEYISRVCFVDSFQGKVAARFAYHQLKKKTAAILYDTASNYSIGLSSSFEKEFTALGGKILKKLTFQSEDKKFQNQLSQIKGLKPDVVFLPSYYPTAGSILNQAKPMNINTIFIGTDGWDSNKMQELAGEGFAGHYFTTHFSAEDNDPVVVEFVKKYQEQYGQKPGFLASLGFDAILLLIEALQKTLEKTSPKEIEKIYSTEFREELKKQIQQTKNFKGVTGIISLDSERNAVKSVVIMQTTPQGAQFFSKIHP